MKRLNHVLPNWNRIQWTSIENKQKYEPIIKSINTMWAEVERMSVVRRLRPAALQIIPAEILKDISETYIKKGVLVVPLSKEKMSHDIPKVSEFVGVTSSNVRVAFVNNDANANEFFHYWNNVDDSTRIENIGRLLGYPKCCIDFYKKYTNEQNFLDMTWPMATNNLQIKEEDVLVHISADSPIEANTLWRWQDVQLVSHTPCSFNCKQTVEIGIKNAQLARDLGYNTEIDWVYELLSWPVEWSALHGIGEIKTPINKISSRTDMTPWKYSVQKQSHTYPEDGMSGITYPYSQKKIKIKPITQTLSFAKSLEDTSVWEENGFSNKEAMDHFHQVILDAVGDMKYIPGGNVLDLGCGNGVLLGRVVGDRTDLLPYGVEINRQRCMSAATTIHWGIFTMGDIFDFKTWNENHYSMILLMPGRLLETTQAKRNEMRKQLHEKTDLLLINLTADWTQQYGSIENIMKITELDQDWEPAGNLIHRQDDIAQLFKRKV